MAHQEHSLPTNLGELKFKENESAKKIAFAAMILGAIIFAATFYTSPLKGWVNLLLGFVFVTYISLCGAFLLGIQAVTHSAWLVPYKRVPEAMAKFLPFSFIFFIPLYFGIHTLYEWSHVDVVANDPVLILKKAYLNEKFFLVRVVFYFLLWAFLPRLLINNSLEADRTGMTEKLMHNRLKHGAIFLVAFGLSVSFFAFDFIMSLEPHWFSTMFGVYNFAGMFVGGLAFMGLFLIHSKSSGNFVGIINENHQHDIGKLMFGISTFFAYIWFSQFMLIWYANIPEETGYFMLRWDNPTWKTAFFLNIIFSWVIPFFVLLPRGNKRNPKIFMAAAVWILFARWFDLYLMIAPAPFHHHDFHHGFYSWTELSAPLFFGGFYYLAISKLMTKEKLIPVGDAYLQEGIHLHQ